MITKLQIRMLTHAQNVPELQATAMLLRRLRKLSKPPRMMRKLRMCWKCTECAGTAINSHVTEEVAQAEQTTEDVAQAEHVLEMHRMCRNCNQQPCY
jgi:Fe2+ or Zn2+ uptake regulation protein